MYVTPVIKELLRCHSVRYLPVYQVMLTHVPSSANAMLENNQPVCCEFSGCHITIDMAIEQTINRSTETVGGIVGFSRNVNDCSRWCLTQHKKA